MNPDTNLSPTIPSVRFCSANNAMSNQGLYLCSSKRFAKVRLLAESAVHRSVLSISVDKTPFKHIS